MWFKAQAAAYSTERLLIAAREGRKVLASPVLSALFPLAADLLECHLAELMRRARDGTLQGHQYQCTACGAVCFSPRTDEEARSEFEAQHGRKPGASERIVCEDCYHKAVES